MLRRVSEKCRVALAVGICAAVWVAGLPSIADAQPAASAFFGSVEVSPAVNAAGETIPFRTSDCDGDGALDLEIAWSLPPTPVKLSFHNVSGTGALPTVVTLEIMTDNATVRAFDNTGVEQDSVTALPTFSGQSMLLEYSGGIQTVTIEGTQLCLLDVCWFIPSPKQFIRGDANADGNVDVADIVAILQYVFGTGTIPCVVAADANDSETVDVSDAIYLIDTLFLGVAPQLQPFPNCDVDPTPGSLPCFWNLACPVVNEQACIGSPHFAQGGMPLTPRSGVLDPPALIDAAGIVQSATGPSVHFLMQADSLPLDKPTLGQFGINVHEYLGDNAFVAVADVAVVSQWQNAIPGVRWAGPLTPILKLDPLLQGGDPAPLVPWAITPNNEIGLNVTYHVDVTDVAASAAATSAGGTVISTLPELRLCQVVIDKTLVQNLALAEELYYMHPVVPPLEGTNDASRAMANVDPLWEFPYDLTGAGIVAAVYDSGNIDSNHPDFGGRIIEIESPLEGSSEHATHVAGTLGGSGINSPAGGGAPGEFAGMAPGVAMRSFGYGQHINPLFDNPSDLLSNIRGSSPTDLANMSLGNNVVLNGFDCRQLGVYTTTSRVVDSIVLGEPAASGGPAEPAIPFIQAAGNERQMGTPCGTFGTIGSPATAKNSIAVGAVDFTGMSLTSFSSIGPTNDGRIKPDLVTLGCVDSTIPGTGYDWKCGTSMASPSVAGIVALLLEEWRWVNHIDEFDFAPFPPHTVKAVLIHSAVDIGQPGPDYQFGWGRVDAKAAIDLIRADFVASAAGSSLIRQDDVSNGFEQQVEFTSDGSTDQKFTLVWDDPLPSAMAAQDLVNDLDLRVVDPNGVTYFPLRPDPIQFTSPATMGVDTLNNVEQVLAPAAAGIWNVFVNGTRVMTASQPFTLIREPSATVPTGPCTEMVRKSIEFTPPWVGGDRDFFGNGPFFDVTATLEVRDLNELWLKYNVEASESVPDFTLAEGVQEHLVYYDCNVASITVLSGLTDGAVFGPVGPGPVGLDLGTSFLLRHLIMYGDTDGSEAGHSTRCRIVTNDIELSCTPAAIPSLKQVIEVDPVHFVPPHVAGDTDFDDNGPLVALTATLSIGGATSNELIATITMSADETPGTTSANGSMSFTVYTHPAPITSILSPTSSTATYTDDDWLDDRPIPVGGLVREFRVVGDTDGGEAGSRTGVTVDFNPIRFMEL